MDRWAAIVGATGPTGIHLAPELARAGLRVRVLSRSAANLARAFPGADVERIAADALDPESLVRAIEGCERVFDCIGLPASQMSHHPRTARAIATAVGRTGARCVHVSSYWAFTPVRRLPVDEGHPREGGSEPARQRREAEEILRGAGAAIVNLPDFYGPRVHVSTLQRALEEATSGKTVSWIGSTRTEREYVYVPDAMAAVARLSEHPEAYGEHWIVPGPGPIALERVLEIASRHLGRRVRARGAGPLLLRGLSLVVPDLRDFLPLVPVYVAPIRFDGSRLGRLLGDVPATPYDEAIPRTLDAIAAAAV